MKRLLLLLLLGLSSRLMAAAPEVTTADALKEEGVTCRRVELQALTSSVEIDVTIDGSKTPGRYAGAECVVLKEPIAADKLAEADAAATAGGPVARRARSDKPSPVFLVLGRELPRAYLAFEFSVPGSGGDAAPRRYLLPVAAIGGPPAPPPAPPEPDTPGPH